MELSSGPRLWNSLLALDSGTLFYISRLLNSLVILSGTRSYSYTLELSSGPGLWNSLLALDSGTLFWPWTLELSSGPRLLNSLVILSGTCSLPWTLELFSHLLSNSALANVHSHFLSVFRQIHELYVSVFLS